MKEKLRSLLISTILIFILFFVLWVGYVGFIGGPARAYEHEDQLYLETMLDQQQYRGAEAELLNRFSLDTVYYITRVTQGSESFIVWFNKDFSSIEEVDDDSLERALPAAGRYAMDISNVSWGVYKDELVYVLKKEGHELFLDRENLEVVFEVGGLSYVVE